MQGRDSLSHLFVLCKGSSGWFLSGSFGVCVQGFLGIPDMVFRVPDLHLSPFRLCNKFRESQGLVGINNVKPLTRGAACSRELSHGAGLGVCSPQLPGLAASPGLLPAPGPTLEPSAGGSGCVSSIWI